MDKLLSITDVEFKYCSEPLLTALKLRRIVERILVHKMDLKRD